MTNTFVRNPCMKKGHFFEGFFERWQIRLRAIYKTDTERVCHRWVRNTFGSCEKFGRILHAAWQIRPNFSHVWGIRSVRNTVQQCLILMGVWGGNLGVIVIRVCEPVFQNLPNSCTWPLKNGPIRILHHPKCWPIHILPFDFLYPFIAGS